MLLRKLRCRHLTRRCFSQLGTQPNPPPATQHDDQPAAVISFQSFIPSHAKFVNRPSTPLSHMICYQGTDYDYDIQLGRHFNEMLDFYIETSRVGTAANLMRAVVCGGLLHDTEAVSQMKRSFVNALNNQFTKLQTEDYLDVAFRFYTEELYSCFIRSVISKLLTNDTDVISDKISRLHNKVSDDPESRFLLTALYTTLTKEILKSEQYQHVHQIHYAHLSRDTAFLLCKRYCALGRFQDAVELVKENGTRNKGLVYTFYKRVSRDPVLGDAEMGELEEWMKENGFRSVVVERTIGVHKDVEEEVGTREPWDDLQLM